MKKKLDIPKDFWKDFKDRKDFDEFFSELFKEGINQMLKAEMTDHLGYDVGQFVNQCHVTNLKTMRFKKPRDTFTVKVSGIS